MPATTPPKGRPTVGRRDRNLARRRSRSRSTTKKFLWGLAALAVLAAIIVLGSSSGGSANLGQTNLVLPLALLRLSTWRWEPAPRS